MLRDDPIVLQYPHYLPTEAEIAATVAMLELPEHAELREALEQHIRIGGPAEASLWRFCWQARQDGSRGDLCAQGAVAWVRRCMEARDKLGMNTILDAGSKSVAKLFSPEFRRKYMAAFPFSFHGVDKHGHPVSISRYGSVDVAALKAVWQEGEAMKCDGGLVINGAVLFYLRTMEYNTKVVMGEQAAKQGRAVDRLVAILDFAGAGLRLWEPEVKAFLAGISQESTPLFPETLHRMVVANVPWLVSKAVWPVAKSFLHPVTQAKITMTSSGDLKEKLTALIDEESLPPFLGGRCTCEECSSGALRGGSMWYWEEAQKEQAMKQQAESEAGQCQNEPPSPEPKEPTIIAVPVELEQSSSASSASEPPTAEPVEPPGSAEVLAPEHVSIPEFQGEPLPSGAAAIALENPSCDAYGTPRQPPQPEGEEIQRQPLQPEGEDIQVNISLPAETVAIEAVPQATQRNCQRSPKSRKRGRAWFYGAGSDECGRGSGKTRRRRLALAVLAVVTMIAAAAFRGMKHGPAPVAERAPVRWR